MSSSKEDKVKKYREWAARPSPERPIHTDVKIGVGLKYLEAAIEKEKRGTSGICEDCGGEIPEKRRLVVPGAIRCTECQSDFDADKASK